MSGLRVLHVCLGNICRSPLAEAAFRAKAEATGLVLEVDSAGTGAWHVGEPPDPRAQAIARRKGLDISGLRARQIAVEDFARFDWIFALDRENLATLRRMAPQNAVAKLGLLLDLVPGREGQPVNDPYYGDAADFETTWADVEAAAAVFVARVSQLDPA